MEEPNEKAAARVERGAAWLDTLDMHDWPWRVDLEVLSMTSPSLCVAGQVFASEAACCGFCHLRDLLPLDERTSHGFINSDGVSPRDLHDAWSRLIAARRAVAA